MCFSEGCFERRHTPVVEVLFFPPSCRIMWLSFSFYFFLLQNIECSKSTLSFTILFFYISSIFQCVIKENCINFPIEHYISEQREKNISSWCKAVVQGHSLLFAGTESGAKYTAHVWGRRRLGCMVVAHATMHGGCQLASSFGQRLRPLAMAVWPHNEASLLFVEAPVQLRDSWASCARPLFTKTCQKVFRPGPFMRSIISSSCPVRVILSFRFHIHDLYLVFISFENVLNFFFPSPFFCIIST
jgi:hypothetical protein